MAITTGELYIGATVLLVIILCVTIGCLSWYFYWHRKRQGKGFEKLPSYEQQQQKKKHPVVNTPTIDISTVKFTVPTTNSTPSGRPYSWAPKSTDLGGELEGFSAKEHRSGTIGRGSSESNIGLLKPELYMGSDDNAEDQDEDLPLTNIGRVWFNLEYDAGSEKLIVNVDRVRNLPGRQQRTSLALSSSSSSSSCDPFLRLYLLPDEKRYLQSKMKRKTRSPTFKETFMFTMSYNLLVERTLRITVFDVDRFMRQTVIGHVLFPLEHLDITRAVALWRDVERSSQISSGAGRLQVGLTHFPQINRVAVNIIRGQKIENDEVSLPDSYVKVTYSVLSKTHKVKKTSVHKASKEPLYNQTFEFKIDQQGLEVACFNFDVLHSTSGLGKNDKSLGSFIIGGGLCARGKELEHWTDMLQKPQTVVKEWHSLKS